MTSKKIEKNSQPQHLKIIEDLEAIGITRYQISQATGIGQNTMSVWIKKPDIRPHEFILNELKKFHKQNIGKK